MNKHLLGIVTALALTATAAHAQTTATVSGKIVDLATFMTHDHNMDSMKPSHDAMSGDGMHADSMKSDSMGSSSMSSDSMHGSTMAAASCPATLALVTGSGKVYLLVTEMGTAGSARAQALCKFLGTTTSLSGSVYTQGGMTALLVK